jgi:YidC/Oxa1 family membrane protein insertase
MDRKTVIILASCILLMLAWQPLTHKIWPPIPLPPGSTNAPAATNAALTSTTNGIGATNNAVPPAISTPPPELRAAPPPPPPPPSTPEETLTLTNGPARYIFTSHGGGLKEVQLFNYPELIQGRTRTIASSNFAAVNTPSRAPLLAAMDGALFDGDGAYQLTRTTNGVRAEKSLTNGLRVVKEFSPTTNYLILASVRVTNVSNAALTLPAQRWITGTSTPLNPEDNGLKLGLMWFNGSSATEINQGWFDNTSFLSCIGMGSKQPRFEYRAGASNVVWAAAQNQFFAVVAMPTRPALDVECIELAVPRPAEWPPPHQGQKPTVRAFQSALVFPGVALAPGEGTRQDIVLYAGPKEYRTLTRVSDALSNKVDLVMGYGGFFGFFAKILLISMNGLHDLLHLGYGWVIILITVLIKALFWPLTQISTRSMKRLQALQPEMKKIQEKYKDDPAKMNKKTMEFMREHKVSPLGGCLPMLIQLPIFFGFYSMIQSAIELRGESFLWVADLSRPDTLFRLLPATLDLPFNLLPLLMGVTMLWQARITPVSPGMDPAQQKLMKYMPLMFLVILYNFSAGLTLYWTVQNLLSILQMKLTKTTDPTAPAPASTGKGGVPVKAAALGKKKGR